MPYHQLEELGTRRHEKVALYLTFENAVGLIAGAMPAYLVLAATPGIVRILFTIVCGALGVMLTFDTAGLPMYIRLFWRVRGLIRIRTRGILIIPETLIGSPHRATSGQARALRIGGAVRLALAPALQHQPATHVSEGMECAGYAYAVSCEEEVS